MSLLKVGPGKSQKEKVGSGKMGNGKLEVRASQKYLPIGGSQNENIYVYLDTCINIIYIYIYVKYVMGLGLGPGPWAWALGLGPWALGNLF